MKKKILIVDDDISYCENLRDCLQRYYDVHIAFDSDTCFQLTKNHTYNVILLDMALGAACGNDVIDNIRHNPHNDPKSHVAIILVSGTADKNNSLTALQKGADATVTKPIHLKELIEKIEAVDRRSHGTHDEIITIGAIELNVTRNNIKIDGYDIILTPKQLELFKLLIIRRGSVLSKEIILANLYDQSSQPKEPPQDKIVDVLICKIRQAIKKISNKEYIATEWGKGHKILEKTEQKVLNTNQQPLEVDCIYQENAEDHMVNNNIL